MKSESDSPQMLMKRLVEQVQELPVAAAIAEFGRLDAVWRQLGEVLGRARSGQNRDLCAVCKKPFVGRGPLITVPVFDSLLNAYVNKHACSNACGSKLRDQQHRAAAEIASRRGAA